MPIEILSLDLFQFLTLEKSLYLFICELSLAVLQDEPSLIKLEYLSLLHCSKRVTQFSTGPTAVFLAITRCNTY